MKFLKLLILLPIAALVVVFAVSNRQTISVSFDPFSSPDASTAFVTAPLFVLLFLALMTGVVLGGMATWFSQGVNRRAARAARQEAEQWRDEAERLRREPQSIVPAGQSLIRSHS